VPDRKPSQRNPLRAAVQQVIDLYDAWDRLQAAARWLEELPALEQSDWKTP
jgi:hypothetical protein